MAKKKEVKTIDRERRKYKRTSIGKSRNSRPKNKHKRKQCKRNGH